MTTTGWKQDHNPKMPTNPKTPVPTKPANAKPDKKA